MNPMVGEILVIPRLFRDEKTVLEMVQDVSTLNKFRCVPSDKKQLYLLIL